MPSVSAVIIGGKHRFPSRGLCGPGVFPAREGSGSFLRPRLAHGFITERPLAPICYVNSVQRNDVYCWRPSGMTAEDAVSRNTTCWMTNTISQFRPHCANVSSCLCPRFSLQFLHSTVFFSGLLIPNFPSALSFWFDVFLIQAF